MRRFVTAFFAGALVMLLGSTAQAQAPFTMEEAPQVPYIFMHESLHQDTLFWNSQYVTSEDTLAEFFGVLAAFPVSFVAVAIMASGFEAFRILAARRAERTGLAPRGA